MTEKYFPVSGLLRNLASLRPSVFKMGRDHARAASTASKAWRENAFVKPPTTLQKISSKFIDGFDATLGFE